MQYLEPFTQYLESTMQYLEPDPEHPIHNHNFHLAFAQDYLELMGESEDTHTNNLLIEYNRDTPIQQQPDTDITHE